MNMKKIKVLFYFIQVYVLYTVYFQAYSAFKKLIYIFFLGIKCLYFYKEIIIQIKLKAFEMKMYNLCLKYHFMIYDQFLCHFKKNLFILCSYSDITNISRKFYNYIQFLITFYRFQHFSKNNQFAFQGDCYIFNG